MNEGCSSRALMGERDPETLRNGALECLSLAAAKARGKKLGTPANLRNPDVGRIQGRAKHDILCGRF
jgi:hypothetical protein